MSKADPLKNIVEQPSAGAVPSSRAIRETVESIVIAFILAFLFRTFEAEAFVIPTGSMAPTLQGMHKDVFCTECGYNYRVGASGESADEIQRRNRGLTGAQLRVEQDRARTRRGSCPMCGYERTDLDAESTYSGDRILVNKFAYEMHEPQRWDVFVFRFPGDAKMNYIKRLVGLPNESIHLANGDVFVGPNPLGNAALKIARKPPEKLRAMLQDVDDNHYIAKELVDVGYPRRWQWEPESGASFKESLDDVDFDAGRGKHGTRVAQRWKIEGDAKATSWIEFSHFEPDNNAWSRARDFAAHVANKDRAPNQIEWERRRNELRWNPAQNISIAPVTDYYPYNSSDGHDANGRNGRHSVGDLAIECDLNLAEAAGDMAMVLREGAFEFHAVCDLKAGELSLQILDLRRQSNSPFGDDGKGPAKVLAKTSLARAGKHKLMFANCDDKLYFWIDDKEVEFDGPTEYANLNTWEPFKTNDGDADVHPARIGVTSVKGGIEHLRLLRDVYYVPTRRDVSEEEWREIRSEIARNPFNPPRMPPEAPDGADITFHTGPDEFFPMGDNSPASSDGRIWTDAVPGLGHTVERRLLIGKALFIYWPHGRDDVVSWFPWWPNFSRMRLIR